MKLRADTRMGAALGRVVRTSDPTAMAVMLTEGTWGRTLRETQLNAVLFDWPMPRISSFGMEMVTSMPVFARAVSMGRDAS